VTCLDRTVPESLTGDSLEHGPELAQRAGVGADLLVPGMFERCGLAPLIGMRYGTVLVVRAVGEMAGTVFDRDYPAPVGRAHRVRVFARLTTCRRVRAEPYAGIVVRLPGRIPPARAELYAGRLLAGLARQEHLSICGCIRRK